MRFSKVLFALAAFVGAANGVPEECPEYKCPDGTKVGSTSGDPFVCQYDCPDVCPTYAPDSGDKCYFSKQCDYGTQTCCGEKSPEKFATCEGGVAYIAYVDTHCVLGLPCEASTSGDPHFKTWNGDKFDFHGGCDLVLAHNPTFANGLGMDIHIRTKISSWWSSIEAAVLRIGEDTLEVIGNNDDQSYRYWVNGEEGKPLEDGAEVTTLSEGYPVTFHKVGGDRRVRFRVELGDADAVAIETFKDFVRVNAKLKKVDKFKGMVGVLGSYPEGLKMARDGSTVIEDANDFGQEWKVREGEAQLFHTEGVPANAACAMPDPGEKQARRLGESLITTEDAALACAYVKEADRDECIFDVLAINDISIAGSY